MKTYTIADTHFNPGNIATYCDRPSNFTEIIIRNWKHTIQKTDLVIHVGDVFIGKHEGWDVIWPELPGRKILIRGNHDKRSLPWWMEHGFDFACDAMVYRGVWFTHKPAEQLPRGCQLNVHGHLHNIWHGFHKAASPTSPENKVWSAKKLRFSWQRLFAIEYTNYYPVEIEKFLSHPNKYQSRGPIGDKTRASA